MRADLLSFAGMVVLGCGARSQLSLGDGETTALGGSGGDSGGVVPVDPEVECPLTCTAEACLPFVLVDDVPVGWHTIVDGLVYYTTAKPDGDNGLFRLGACGGEPQLLLASEQFFGYGAVIDDEVYVTADGPETVRLPKWGGTPTLYHSGVGDVLTTLAVSHRNYYGYPTLVRYHFDQSFGFYSFNEDGDLVVDSNSIGDYDYEASPSEGFGFLPNLPAVYWVGSTAGVVRAIANSGPALTAVPVAGPLVAIGEGEMLYFTGVSGVGGVQHYSVSTGEDSQTTPILGGTPGLILAADTEALFGGFIAPSEHQGTVWRALPDDAAPAALFRSAEYVQDIVPAGKSLYARTERRLVRVPKTCPGDAATPCTELD